MLLRWVRVALVFQQRERANKFRSGQRWFDYFVDEAPEGTASQGGDGGCVAKIIFMRARSLTVLSQAAI